MIKNVEERRGNFVELFGLDELRFGHFKVGQIEFGQNFKFGQLVVVVVIVVVVVVVRVSKLPKYSGGEEGAEEHAL